MPTIMTTVYFQFNYDDVTLKNSFHVIIYTDFMLQDTKKYKIIPSLKRLR